MRLESTQYRAALTSTCDEGVKPGRRDSIDLDCAKTNHDDDDDDDDDHSDDVALLAQNAITRSGKP